MITTLLLCSLLQSQLLVRHSPQLIESQIGGNKLFYESAIPGPDALQVLRYLRSAKGVEPVPYIYRMPNSPNRFVASALMQVQKEEPQRRLIVLSKEPNRFREVYKSSGVGDSWILTPTFFVGTDRIMILAELGAEEYFGLIAFEVIGDRVTSLGRLDVSRQVNRNGAIEFVSPLTKSKVEYSNGAYKISFFGDIYVDHGLPTQRKISDRKRVATVVHDGSNFRLPLSGSKDSRN